MTVSVSNCPSFLDSPIGCVDGVSSHGLRRSEIESRHHLLVVLRIHNLLFQDVYLENSREMLLKFCPELGGIRTYLNLLEMVDIV